MAVLKASPRLKAFVLLKEEEYLKENIRNPESYFHALRREGVLSREQCSEIKRIQGSQAQISKLVELISADQRGFDVLMKAARSLRVESHIAIYLKKKAAEIAELGVNESHEIITDQLSAKQRERLTMLDFVTRTHLDHNMARDILSQTSWNLTAALEAAKSMGYDVRAADTPMPYQENSPRSSSSCSLSDYGEFGSQSFGIPSDGSSMNSAASSNRNSSGSDLPCDNSSADYHPDVGRLPPHPPQTLSSPSPPDDPADVHPQYGPLPFPPHSSGDPPTTWGDDAAGCKDSNPQRPMSLSNSVPPPSSTGSAILMPATPSPSGAGGMSPRKAVVYGVTSDAGKANNSHQGNQDLIGRASPSKSATGAEVVLCSKTREPANLPHSPRTCTTSSQTTEPAAVASSHEPQSRDAEVKAGRVTSVPKCSPIATKYWHSEVNELGSYWSCYHCSDQNPNAATLCGRCKMLFAYTNPSWSTEGERDSDNYVCKSCNVAVRIPYKPCPQTLVDQLRHHQLCNKCYRATGACLINKATQTERNVLASRPTMVKLQSIHDEDGKEIICIVDEVAPRWDALAPQLGIESRFINILQRDCPTCCQQACLRMFSMWVDRRGEDLTWECLVEAVHRIGERVLAANIKAICSYTLNNEQ